MVRAKFRCEGSRPANGGFEIIMRPVTDGSPENEEFYKWTPAGQLVLTTVNERVASELVQGQEYFIDIHSSGENK